MTITVTQSHIDHGIAGECDTCPVALAIEQATGQHWSVNVDRCFAIIEGRRQWWLTPESVRQFIVAFDHGETREPFSFAFDPDLT